MPSHDAVLGEGSAVVDAKPRGGLHGQLADRALPAAVQGDAAGGSRLLDLRRPNSVSFQCPVCTLRQHVGHVGIDAP